MDVNKLLDSLEGLSKEEISAKAVADANKLIEMIRLYDKDTDAGVDPVEFANSAVKFFLIMVAGVDGRIDQSEYELHCKVYKAAGVEDMDLDTVRGVLQMLKSASEIEERTYSTLMSMAKIVDDNHNNGACDSIVELSGCFFAYNGSIDSSEIALLEKLNSYGETGYVDNSVSSAEETGSVSA